MPWRNFCTDICINLTDEGEKKFIVILVFFFHFFRHKIDLSKRNLDPLNVFFKLINLLDFFLNQWFYT